MTDDELDLLASAYVDGEATPEEVALVERDPELQARVEAFRAVEVDGAITPPPGLVDRHLATAMAEFDAVSAAPADSEAPAGRGPAAGAEAGEHDAAPVVDLRAAAARRGRRDSTRAAATRPKRADRPARTMPSWLPAAAGFVIVGGGLVWAIGQTGGSDDSDAGSDATETAAAFDTDDSGDDATAAEGAEESTEAEVASDEEASDESDDAMEEEEAAGESLRSEADAAAAAPADGDSTGSAEDAEADFAVPQPLLFFDEVPDPDDLDILDDLPEAEPDLELSLCGPEIVTDALGEPLGFIPVEIQDQPAELYLFVDGDGTEIRILVDDDCQLLEP